MARRSEAESSQSITITHGNTHKRGAWLVPRQLTVTVRHGTVELDFTEAVFHGAREVEIVLDTRHCNLRMTVPDGSTFDTSALVVRHTNVNQRDLGAAGPNAVRLVISGQTQHTNLRVRKLSGLAARRRAKQAQRALP
ncbi:hypothetical protein ACFQ9X_48950 [Catenulispora yoronensis]